MKTVSVIMCTYNGARFLREQLDSILQQSYPIHEIIVQDDCSTDETVDIVKEYIAHYPVVKLFVNDHNLGFNLNFKCAAMKATGDYVAISDQDDVWFPQKIEKQVAAIGDYDICCSQYVKGSTLVSAVSQKRKFFFECQLFCSICGHTMLCHRSFIQTERYWIPSIWYDWSLTLHAYLNHGVAIVEEPLNWHRFHEKGASYLKDDRKQNLLTPYLKGYTFYHELQKTSNWQLVYNYVYERTVDKEPLVHKICGLLLKQDDLSLFRLCVLCLKHRDRIYPNKRINGLMGLVRAFFFPLFHGYFASNQYRDFS